MITVATEMLLTCVTSPHAQEEVEVSVTVSGKGEASGQVLFIYSVQLSSISHCSGSARNFSKVFCIWIEVHFSTVPSLVVSFSPSRAVGLEVMPAL